jgi:NitT/TauT family transport system permease protein
MAFLNKYGSIAGFLLLWELASRSGLMDPNFFPSFSKVARTVLDLCGNGVMGLHIKVSLTRAVLGFLIAAAVGLPLGLLSGSWFRSFHRALDLPLEVISQINPFLLFHLIIIFMGLGEAPKVTIVAWTCLWPVLFSAINGAQSVNPALIKAGRAFGLSRSALLMKITVPASAPLIFSGLRLSLGYSLFMLIAAEMMGASSGLGWFVIRSQENFQLARMYAAVLVIALLGLALDALICLLGRRYLSLSRQAFLNTPGD